MCYGHGGSGRRSPTRRWCSAASRRTCSAARSRSDVAQASTINDLAASVGLDVYRTAAGILEIAAWSQANAVRQVTVKRGLDVRIHVLVAFGGSGPLQAGKLVDILDLPAALVPPDPGNVSAFGLLTVDVKNDYVTTAVQRDDLLDLDVLERLYARLEAQARDALARRRFPADQMQVVRSADMRYFGQAWEVRVDVPDGRSIVPARTVVVAALPRRPSADVWLRLRQEPTSASNGSTCGWSASGRSGNPAVQPRPHSLAGPNAPARPRAGLFPTLRFCRHPPSTTVTSAARRLHRRASHRRGVRFHHGRIPKKACRSQRR